MVGPPHLPPAPCRVPARPNRASVFFRFRSYDFQRTCSFLNPPTPHHSLPLRLLPYPQTRMAAIAPVAMDVEGGGGSAGAKMAACVAALTVVQSFKEHAGYGSNTHDHTEALDKLFDNRNTTRYQRKCRLSPAETLKLLALMGHPHPRDTKGVFKYNDLHRFMIYLMCMAHYRAFDDISSGTLRKPAHTNGCLNLTSSTHRHAEVGWAVASLEQNITFWTQKVIDALQPTST